MLIFRKRYVFLLSVIVISASVLVMEFNKRLASKSNYTVIGPKLGAPLFNHIGHYHRPITTTSPLTQRYFDQGLIFFYGLNFKEATRSFKEAIRLDPQCAMCYWALSLSLGSKTSELLEGTERKEALKSIKQAIDLSEGCTPLEKAYIEALLTRYSDPLMSGPHLTESVKCIGLPTISVKEASDYAAAMKNVMEAFPDDLEAKNLYVKSMIELMNCQLYKENKQPTTESTELIAILESIFKVEPKNPVAHLFYIQLMEPSLHPEKALTSADFLRNAVPEIEHFVHMSSHIYMLTGRYHDASNVNRQAITAYKEYIGDAWIQGFEPEKTYLIQHHLKHLFSSMVIEGRSHQALETAKELISEIPSSRVGSDEYQDFYVLPYFAKIRFGLWEQILNKKTPKNTSIYPTAMWHYARGMAFTHLNQINHADIELVQLKKLELKEMDKEKRKNIYIATLILNATIFEAKGFNESMITYWKKAVKKENSLSYKNPFIKYFQAEEGLAAAYLKIEAFEKSEDLYKKLLKETPDNGWLLFGLLQSLKLQGKESEAQIVQDQFNKAWSYADITLPIK